MSIKEAKEIFKGVNIDSYKEVTEFYKLKKKELEEKARINADDKLYTEYGKLVLAYHYLCEMKYKESEQWRHEVHKIFYECMENVELIDFIKMFNS